MRKPLDLGNKTSIHRHSISSSYIYSHILYDCPSKPELTRICNELGVSKDQYIKATKKMIFIFVC